MREKTHYQILGIRTEASPAVIEAAYQRLLRQYRTEAILAQQHAGPDEDPELARLEESYRVLSDVTRRQQYDETLRTRRGGVESLDLARRAQQNLAESGAWLSEQRHTAEHVIFRIGWAADFTAVRRALEEAIPPAARHYHAESGEWTVALDHAAVLRDLFDNYTPPNRPVPPRHVDAYLSAAALSAQPSTHPRGLGRLALFDDRTSGPGHCLDTAVASLGSSAASRRRHRHRRGSGRTGPTIHARELAHLCP